MEAAVTIIPALEDNYIYLIRWGKKALVIDPGEASPVIDHLEKENLELVAILLTHHHSDHTNGVAKLEAKFPSVIYAPDEVHSCRVDVRVHDGDELVFDSIVFDVLHTPGHTKEHVIYFEPKRRWLFSGDTLFASGCGKLFEGTAEEMYSSLLRIQALDMTTKVYPGHEYAAENLAFAKSLEPSNTLIQNRYALANLKKHIVPFVLRDEFETNPYFRLDNSELQTTLGIQGGSSTDVFAAIRAKKDSFKPF